ncbi:acetylcholinesterase collagenic tail peptide-like [Salvelinus namaycush]|uniref:Acetylcholinesterase collagenic tail peptide-like n=1 Tax=Salvelinus namaycush TaxID=8040 RepID=A0A8U0U431_SALNM|nr:acetylcholinesterase collagenic tail peptide-like [Salvelinus namaycush]
MCLSALRSLDEPMRIDPCCLLAPPPPPLFPPPSLLWKQGTTGEIGRPGSKGEKGELGLMGLPGLRGPPGTKVLLVPLVTLDPLDNLPQVRYDPLDYLPQVRSPGLPASGKIRPPGLPASGKIRPPGLPASGKIRPPRLPASGLYLVGEKGDKGVAGSPGVCDCNTYGGNTPLGVNNPHYGSYTQRGNYHKVPVIFVVDSEEELDRLHTVNAIAFRKDQRSLYFKDKDGWQPIQPFKPLQSTEKVPERVGVCGDGLVQNREECDDGNNVVTDACLNCRWAYCGDGYRHEGMEECDGKDFGYQTCTSYLPGSFGHLRCTGSCSIDSTGCKYFT